MAHPDDMEYGGAAAVAAWTRAGKRVAYLLVTRGEAGIASMPPEEAARVREAEQRESGAIVGVGGGELLDHHDRVIHYGPAPRPSRGAPTGRRWWPRSTTGRPTAAATSTWPTIAGPAWPRSTPCATPATAGCSPTWRMPAWNRGRASATWPWSPRPNRPTPST